MLIYQYMNGSKSARELSRALGAKRIKREGSVFRGRATKTVINWGCSSLPAEVMKCKVINKPECVSVAANKLQSFQVLLEAGVNIPEFTRDSVDVLQDVLGKDPESVLWLARKELSGHSGSGIELIKGDAQDVPDAPLYTKYVKKKFEYRVHVFGGDVVDVQRKARSREVSDEDVNWYIRNHGNGFIFARNEDHTPNDDVLKQAVDAVQAMGLDFGAVDVIFNESSQKAYVLEVNTAPGLSGTTLDGYVSRFRDK